MPNSVDVLSGKPKYWKCECPDYKVREEACKHIFFAAMLLLKNRGNQTIKNLDGFNGNGNSHANLESKDTSDKTKEAHSRDFDRQSTNITRLEVANTATDILKSNRKPIDVA